MNEKERFGFCEEAYEAVKVVEVWVKFKSGDDRRVRITVFRDILAAGSSYTTSVQTLEDITVQPTFPQAAGGKFERSPQSQGVWTRWSDFPWTQADTQEQALNSALSFLHERCGK